MKKLTQQIVPSLWFAKDAEEATKFYASVFPDSHIDRVTSLPVDSPSGPAGSVKVVAFTLMGQPFEAMTAGPHDDFNDAISFSVNCESQAEIDRYWSAILDNGGTPTACGWINDRFGVRWQIKPVVLADMISDPDREKAKRAAEEMMKQVKFDISKLKAAYEGRRAA